MKEEGFTLAELDAQLLKRIDARHRRHVEELSSADGVMFLCPKCFKANGGPIGTHMVMCWFIGRVPDDEVPGPGRWSPSQESTGLDNLTLVAGSSSIHLTGPGCGWHGYVRGGRATLS